MAVLTIKEVKPEQSITKKNERNRRQFNLIAYGGIVVASLWQGFEEQWYWTKRLYSKKIPEHIDTTYLDDTSINGIIDEFIVRVRDWLDSEESFINGLKNEIDEENVKVVID